MSTSFEPREPPDREDGVTVRRGHPVTTAEVVVVQVAPDVSAPLGVLTALLAEAVATQFGDPVVVIHAPPGDDEGSARPSPSRRAELCLQTPGAEPSRGPVRHEHLDLPLDGRAGGALRAAVERARAAASWVFIDGSAHAHALATRMVYLTRDAEGPVPRLNPACIALRAVLLDGAPARLGEAGVGPSLRDATRDLFGRRRAPVMRRRPYAADSAAKVAPASCRVRLDLGALGRLPRASLGALADTAPFDRLARALTGRRVGAALGGAGAWGYASAVLLDELVARGVPIDIVGGASSGALLGAYYCVGGREGIARLVARGPLIGRLMPLMGLSSAPAAAFLDADLGGAVLEALEVPLLPVVTNLTRMRPELVTAGSVGRAVCASVSAPGVFAPTRVDGEVLVDGAVTDNVPAALVESQGADLLIASNPLPASSRGDAPRWLGPLGRAIDFTTAFELLLHTAGRRETSARRIQYTAAPSPSPLTVTFGYGAASPISDAARRGDRALHAALDAATAAWNELRRPRLPV
jgi:predicted acylesterase/phospholipase RssA